MSLQHITATLFNLAINKILPNFEKFQFEMVKNGEKW